MPIPVEQTNHEYFRPIEPVTIPEILTGLNRDFFPVIPEGTTDPKEITAFQDFVSPILHDTVEKSYAIQTSQVNLEDVTQNILFLLGEPGSGKTNTFTGLKNILALSGVPRNHLNFVGWDLAEHAAIPPERSLHKGGALSDKDMELVNTEAFRQFNEMKNWVTAIAEYAPVGRDAGKSCVEAIIRDTQKRGLNRNIYVLGHCADPRLDYYANPNRDTIGYFHQVLYYRQRVTNEIDKLYTSGQLELPSYMVNGIYGFDYSEFPYKDDINELVDLSMERYTTENPHASTRTLRKERLIRTTQATRSGLMNLSTLFIMNQSLQSMGISPDNILMGKKTPYIEKFRDKPDIFDYFAEQEK